MRVTQKVRKILAGYESDNPGTKSNLARILMHGKLGGTGKMMISAGRPGFRARSRAQLRAQPGKLTIRITISSSPSMPGSTPMRRRSA